MKLSKDAANNFEGVMQTLSGTLEISRNVMPNTDNPNRPPEYSPSMGMLLDILEQVKQISIKVDVGEQTRIIILQKINKVEEVTSQFENILYRVTRLEKDHENILELIQENTDFRIRLESTLATRRTIFGVIAGACGGIGGAVLTYILNRTH